MSRWYDALAACRHAATPHVQAQVVSAAGSTPREPGAQMVITAEHHFDTLGGGRFEQQVIDAARALLREGREAVQLEHFALGVRAGQCCGGQISVLLSAWPGPRCHLALFGAGHVGRAVARQAALLNWPLAWFDSRRDIEPPLAADSGCQPDVDVEAQVAHLRPGAHVLVMTHDHGEDERLIAALLHRQQRSDDIASIGLIGSETKWARFRHRLRDAGFDDASLARVRCPVGLAGARGKRPEEIALAIAAELAGMTPEDDRTVLRGLDAETMAGLEQKPTQKDASKRQSDRNTP
ncbi:xanthine dehydrogenase accessory protein XdhC [Kushneria aurantia]|uniref:Xanthine dehydrogenase accessory protein XdhC n=1 Tax=Kushneria aurantia TaxID=504092 RepID=A0ABV6G495_9GAMM|nr:xanthine dehydrogenase accessory protein XdhC [Kushneria aurantia]